MIQPRHLVQLVNTRRRKEGGAIIVHFDAIVIVLE
jgi:hypothetical protein